MANVHASWCSTYTYTVHSPLPVPHSEGVTLYSQGNDLDSSCPISVGRRKYGIALGEAEPK